MIRASSRELDHPTVMDLPACLCMTVWITCAKQRGACVRRGEMLGIAFRAGAHNRSFTWEIAIRALCIKNNL